MRFSEWAAPIVPIVKEDRQVRIWGDYRLTVNYAAKLESYPIPRIKELFAAMTGGVKFTELDLKNVYQQLEPEEDSKSYTTINTHRGLFRYNRLPFGVTSAPAIFQRTMDSLLQGIPHVAAYLDDILITGEDDQEHLRNLDAVLDRLETADLRLKQSKCAFLTAEVVYMGHRINKEGLQPTSDKVRAVREFPTPGNVAT